MSTRARLTILTYHSLDTSGSVVSVPPTDFADQMSCIADAGFRGISLQQAIEKRSRSGQWPDRSVVITFDDGFASLYDHALPALDRHGFVATVFLISDFVGRHNEWEKPPAGLGLRPILTWEQAGELATAGWEIGSHTRTHPDLRRLSEAQLEREIATSRLELEQRLQRAVDSFAYPYGWMDSRAERLVAREYRVGCTTRLERASLVPVHRLPRVDAFYLKNRKTLGRLLLGHRDGYLTVRRWGRRLRRILKG